MLSKKRERDLDILSERIRESYLKQSKKAIKIEILGKFRKTFNTIIYEIDVDGERLIAKSYIYKDKELLFNEFKFLLELQNTSLVEKYEIPRPIDYYADLGIIVLSKIQGISIRNLIQKFHRGSNYKEVEEAIRHCGKCLNSFHLLFNMSLKYYCGIPIMYSRSYIDFDPLNVILTPQSRLGLIDPPESIVVDPVHRDIGVFLLGLFKAMIIPTSFGVLNLTRLAKYQNIFVNSYFNDNNLSRISFDYTLARFFEYYYGKKVLKRYFNSRRFIQYSYFAFLFNIYLWVNKRKYLSGIDMSKFYVLINNLEVAS
ncbi:MAG: hypothetical protein FJZ16_01915 [Candidatus Omnitrophica bacterium]|nr:hypothetical protein [Candidatus Omnitrophota bacterium]